MLGMLRRSEVFADFHLQCGWNLAFQRSCKSAFFESQRQAGIGCTQISPATGTLTGRVKHDSTGIWQTNNAHQRPLAIF